MENPNSLFRLRNSGFVRPAQLKLQTNIVYSVKMKTTQIDFWNLEMEISGKAVQCPPRSPTMVTQYSLKAPKARTNAMVWSGRASDIEIHTKVIIRLISQQRPQKGTRAQRICLGVAGPLISHTVGSRWEATA